MRVGLVTPWENAWIPLLKDAFERRGHEFTRLKTPEKGFDLLLHGWLSTDPVEGSRNVMFLRRYELFIGRLAKVDWSKVDHLICVNSWIAEIAKQHAKCPVHLVYNSASKKWKWKDRRPNTRIGMACHVHPKKNLPLALQVLAALPEGYELHIAGDIQDVCTAEYLNHVGTSLRRRVYLYGHVDELDLWWEQMGFCLSTSLSEGNPNNVIEAMAKGIKPVVHNWPGAGEQFPKDVIFDSVSEAVAIVNGPYESKRYLELVQEKYSLKNMERVVDICES